MQEMQVYFLGGEDPLEKESAAHSSAGLLPWWGRSPREGKCSPLQCSCLGNPMDREAWWATVSGILKELDMTEGLKQ